MEWLRGETDEYETDITDKRELHIRDAMGSILNKLPSGMGGFRSGFFQRHTAADAAGIRVVHGLVPNACRNFKGNTENADIAATIGFESDQEYNEIMLLREITHTVNAFNDMADIIRLYSKKPEAAAARLANLLSEKDPESV